MDGENNGKPYWNSMDFRVFTPIFGNTHIKKKQAPVDSHT